MIRKAEGPGPNEFIIATLLCFSTHSTVQILKPNVENGSFNLKPVMSAYMPKVGHILTDLIFFIN